LDGRGFLVDDPQQRRRWTADLPLALFPLAMSCRAVGCVDPLKQIKQDKP